uniref:F-box domain-containing protein n=1 Tax=Ditylenchus dipsaci TaxID=166011 RepID=A0A915E5U4_9BILA
MAITIPADIWLEVLTYLGVNDVKNLIHLSNLAFSRLIVYHARKVGFMKEMPKIFYKKSTEAVADLKKTDSGYELVASKDYAVEVAPWDTRVVNTGISFIVPNGVKAKIFSAANPHWALISEECMKKGEHTPKKLIVQNISGNSRPVPANEALAKIIFYCEGLFSRNCYLASSGTVTVPANGIKSVPIQVFIPGSEMQSFQPFLKDGSTALIVGASEFRMGQEVFVVPQIVGSPIPDDFSLDVANSSATDVVLSPGNKLAFFSAYPFQNYDLKLA